MSRSTRLISAAALAAVLVLLLSLYMHSWGGVALVLLAAAGLAWYRIQVARGQAEADQFFADAGEDTRLTSFQGGSPSEMPLDRTMPAGPPAEPPH